MWHWISVYTFCMPGVVVLPTETQMPLCIIPTGEHLVPWSVCLLLASAQVSGIHIRLDECKALWGEPECTCTSRSKQMHAWMQGIVRCVQLWWLRMYVMCQILQQDTVVEAKAKNSKAVYVATTTLVNLHALYCNWLSIKWLSSFLLPSSVWMFTERQSMCLNTLTVT